MEVSGEPAKRILGFVTAIAMVLAAVVGGVTGPAAAEPLGVSPEALEASILSPEEAGRAAGSGGLQVITTSSIPNSCRAAQQFAGAGGIQCTRSWFGPASGAYPYWLEAVIYESPAAARGYFDFVAGYRPKQEGVTGTPTSTSTALDVEYVHAWPSDSVYSMRLVDNRVVSASCVSKRGSADFASLRQCATATIDAQLGRWATQPTRKVTAPSAPLDAFARVEGTSATVSWVRPRDDGGDPVSRYVVTATPSGAVCAVDDVTASTPTLCRFSGLARGVDHAFTVVASNSAGDSPGANASASVAGLRRPGPPTQVRVKVTGTTARVSWAPPRADGGAPVRRFDVTSAPQQLACSSSKSSCTITGLRPGGRYVFTVAAVNAMGRGRGAPSLRVTVANSAPRPTAPVEVKPEPPVEVKPAAPLG